MQAEQFAARLSPILLASGLTKIYRPNKLFAQPKNAAVIAMQDVCLALERGQTLGLIGASGSGKSTLARCLSCLERPDGGKLSIDGQDVLGLNSKGLRNFRRRVQLVMQGSAASLNPRFSAIDAVAEPFEIAGYS